MDEQLLRAAAAGDGDAFAQFWRRHVREVTAYAIRRCVTSDDVADLVADTFLVAYRSAGRYRPDRPTALPWLLGIARRVASRQRWSLARRLRLSQRVAGRAPRFVDDEADAIAAAIDAHRQASALGGALADLPARDREVLELIAYAQLNPSEAAQALGITPNAARLRLARARKRLQAQPPEHTPNATSPGGAP